MNKMHSIYATLLGLLVLVGSTTVQAVPVTIDFEGFASLQSLNGDVEDGFVLTDLGTNQGVVTPPGFGTGGAGSMGFGPGGPNDDPYLEIVRPGDEVFVFTSLESWFQLDPAVPTTVEGFLNDVSVGLDIFFPTGPLPGGDGPVVPTQLAVNLAGVTIDALYIDLGIGNFEGPQAVDNIVLDIARVPVPLPSTLLLLGMAMFGLTRVRRTR